MPKIKITNPRNVIEAPIKKNYFKIRATSGPKGDKGDTGATGPQGPQGPQGNAATIYVGSTTTLPVGQDATVENVGSQYAAVLNFGIPQGPQGPQGAKGDKGDKGDKGEQGNTGNTGPAGQNATVYIGTTTTGAPGSQASVYNSGTENNAVLNFTIPRGQKGDTGATGATGPQGPAGQDGKDFAPSVVDSLPAVGEESKLYLTPKAHTTQTATGNPITATVTDGAGQIEDFQLDGDTYQQSYTGKNLFNPTATPWVQDVAYNASGQQHWSGYYGINEYQPVEASTQYAFSNNLDKPIHYGLAYYDSSKNLISTNLSDLTTFTTPASCAFIRFAIQSSTAPTWTQLELGSAATSFEPYVGGVPSPNPSYPQQVQTVTGTQTVAINGTNYPLDLGTIELCKIGTYQDYIYKDGDTWKVHNAMSKVLIDGTVGTISNPSTNRFNLDGCITDYKRRANSSFALCDQYISIGQTDNNAQFNTNASGYECCINFGSATASVIRFKNTKISTSDDFADALEAHPLTMYYVLATATDTEITDSTLIAQLNAIASASLETGTNTLTNSATGSNLAGDMEVDYFGYDPTNRYDKWLWLDINNAYEKLGS